MEIKSQGMKIRELREKIIGILGEKKAATMFIHDVEGETPNRATATEVSAKVVTKFDYDIPAEDVTEVTNDPSVVPLLP